MYNFKTKREPFARGFLNCESENKSKRCAAGAVLAAKEMDLRLDLKLGLCYGNIDGGATYNFCGLHCSESHFKRLAEKYPEEKEDFLYIKEHLAPLADEQVSWTRTPEQEINCSEGYMWAGGWEGHANPDHADVCHFGTDALREKIEKNRALNPGKDDFYDACSMTMDALDILGQRYREKALEMLESETDPENIKKLQIIARTFEHAPKAPCRDFAEAIVVFVLVYTFDGQDSPGWFDQYMYDFWKVTDEKLRLEYLDHVWEFFHNTRAWNLCISGSDENWNDLTNDLSYAVLKIVKEKKYQTPNLTMRCHRNTPEALYVAAYEALATGCGLPGLYNDEAVVPALERLGIPSADAHMYVMNGCNQIDIQGKSHMGLEDGQFTVAKAVEFALHNGRSNLTGKDLGLKTGNAADFETFEEFYAAVIAQLDYIMKLITDLSNTVQACHGKYFPGPFRSVLIDGCLEKGREYKNGGPLYGNGQILLQAFAETVDSVVAVKKFVYDDKRFTMAELVDALEKNFEGYDEMYHVLKHSSYRFGNDIEYVDKIAGDLMDHVNGHLLTIPTFRGGHFSGGCSPFVGAPDHGATLGALPSGHKKGDELIADSIGATPGYDINGPTALLNSCLAFDHTLPGSGFILNLKFDSNIFNSEIGKAAFITLWKNYFERKGQMITATVVSAEELLDAQKNPDAHRDLIVRVGGYCDYFVNISKELQDNVIARTCLNI
ncbi:MAG: hypothetical protein IKT70_07910 [Clostridia bacterium]|nr:hypothetical protein [Clostridia bacterium]